MSFEVAELQRQFFNLVKIGTVEKVDYNKSTAQVRFGNVVTDYLPWISVRAGLNYTYNPLDRGEQVLVLSPPGGAIGVIIGSLYNKAHSAPEDDAASADIQKTIYEDGSTITYDRKASVLTADIKGDVVVKTTRSITANAGTSISATAEEDISATSTGGNISVVAEGGDIAVDASGSISIKAGSNATIKASTIELNGTTFINGTMTQNGGTGGSASFKGSLNTDGDITTKADVIANVSLNSHRHKCPDGVTEGPI